MTIAHDEIINALDYNPNTGIFLWNIRSADKIKIGSIAGSKPTPYIRIRFKNKYYLAHRLAWFYMTGKFPSGVIDHINGVPSDNRFSNLRDTTQEINTQNRKKPKASNKSGFVGVSCKDVKFIAAICVRGKRIYIGAFADFESAKHEYIRFKEELHNGYIK